MLSNIINVCLKIAKSGRNDFYCDSFFLVIVYSLMNLLRGNGCFLSLGKPCAWHRIQTQGNYVHNRKASIIKCSIRLKEGG